MSFLEVIAVVTILAIIAFLMLYILVKNDILFTVVKPGTAKNIMYLGSYSHTVFNFPGYVLFNDGSILDPEKEDPDYQDGMEHAEIPTKLLGGVRFVGIPFIHSVYKYFLRWSVSRGSVGDLSKDAQGTRSGSYVEAADVLQRSETVSEFYLKATSFALLLDGAEDIDKIPISLVLVVFIAIRNPFRAAFRVNNWWEASSDKLLAAIRPLVASVSWEELKGFTGNLAPNPQDVIDIPLPEPARIFSREIRRETEWMKEHWGVHAVDIRISNVIPPPEIAKVATERYTAEQKAEAAVAEAEGKAKAILTIADADQERNEKVLGGIQEIGDQAVSMAIAEKLSQGENNTIVIPSSLDLGDLTKRIGGI